MKFKKDNVSLKEVDHIAHALSTIAHAGDVFVLVGDIGAGKTTLISSIAHDLGIDEAVTSPTFAIVAEYKLPVSRNGIERVVHVDTYRLTHVNELYDLGFETIFDDHSITFIEWGERIEDYIDKNHIRIVITEDTPESRSYECELTGIFPKTRVGSITRQLITHDWIQCD